MTYKTPTRGYTLQKKTRDDMIKIAPTVEIYNRSMVQKHPVYSNPMKTIIIFSIFILENWLSHCAKPD